MSVCGDFGGETREGKPCAHPSDGLCYIHRPEGPPPDIGRPTGYTPEARETVIALGRIGASRAEWAAELDIAIQTLHNWEGAHPEFLEATTRARDLAQAWWEEQGRKGITSRDFNASAYRLQVMNRFPSDWRDKTDLDLRTPDGIQMDDLSDDQLKKRAGELTNRLGAFMHSTNGSANGSGRGQANGA